MAVDLVCGMQVDPQTAEYRTQYRGKEYVFCSFDCKKQFDLEPEAFINPSYTPPEARK